MHVENFSSGQHLFEGVAGQRGLGGFVPVPDFVFFGGEGASVPIDTFGHHRQFYGSSKRGQTDRKGPMRGHFLEPAVMHVQDTTKPAYHDYSNNRDTWLAAIQ